MWRNTTFVFVVLGLLLSVSDARAQDSRAESVEAAERLNTIGITLYGLAPIVVYERILPLGEQFGVIGSVGGFYYEEDAYGYVIGATLYVGGPKHRAEFGGAYLNETLTIAYSTYRYTHNSGWFGKLGLGYTFMEDEGAENGVVPMLGLGYAF